MEDQLDCSISPLKDFIVTRTINKSKYSVYLIISKVNNKRYAVKVFPYKNKKISSYYLFEKRFKGLKHPNIVSIFDVQDQKLSFSGNKDQVSYILMELAPYGDFSSFIHKQGFQNDHVLVRTYFQQLVSAVEYLHKQRIAHTDLKPGNLLICEEFKLKVTDFDFAVLEEDGFVTTAGTSNFRAPEIIASECVDPLAADIYSMGVILFCFCFNSLPYIEDSIIGGYDLYKLLTESDPLFWTVHKLEDADPDLKNLITKMCTSDRFSRLTIQQVKNSEWFNGKVYSEEELATKMSALPYIKSLIEKA